MEKYIIEADTLKRLASAIRKVSGTTRTYTPTEMIEAVSTILENGAYILVDENGVEIPAVFVSNDEVFTATANDIRINTTAVTEEGVTVGEKVIPSYVVTEGYRLVPNGSEYSIPFGDELYDFTKLQIIICPYSSSVDESVAAEKVVINDSVYTVNSDILLSTVERDATGQSINLGITNESGARSVMRYFTYKEIY